jgi:hypothetical protein
MIKNKLTLFAAVGLIFSGAARGEVKSVVERNDTANASAQFSFRTVPKPSKADGASKAKFTIVDGEPDRNGGTVAKLSDGNVPADGDQPSESFFFNAGTDGGRIAVDLGAAIDIKQINTYSWHSSTRAPQVYQVYGSDGVAPGFNKEPKRAVDPVSCGWKLIGSVDARPKEGVPGGQYGVAVTDLAGSLGKYRYLLFEMAPTEKSDAFGNTFYSEIDVIDRNAPTVADADASKPATPIIIQKKEGKYNFAFDVTLAPDLRDWVEKDLTPVVRDWYPRIVKLLPSDGYEAPATVTIAFREGMRGTPAAAGGNRISCNIEWFRGNLRGEAKGAVVHELVHVVQQYGRARRNNPNATRTPGWLVEGIADYIRWFLYEPESKGAEITARNIARARYDANYRISANFLNWVTGKFDKELVKKLNAAAREGKYNEELWKEWTGKTVQELGDEWKKAHETRLNPGGQPAS